MEKKCMHILPKSSDVRMQQIIYTTFEYRMIDNEVQDVESTVYDTAEIPELDFLTWLELCLQLKGHNIAYTHYYMKKVVPYDTHLYDPEQYDGRWSYFTKIENNRLVHKYLDRYVLEMLLYYIKDFDYYVMIKLESHRGQLLEVVY